MTTTKNLGLNLPGKSDYVDIEKINENFQTLDVHTHTMESLGAAPADHNHDGTYSKQGHTHTPENVGAAIVRTYSATVTTSWIASGDYYYQDINVSGILETDNPDVDILCGSDNAANKVYSENICKVLHITTSDNSIRVWATEAISTAFPIQLKVVR